MISDTRDVFKKGPERVEMYKMSERSHLKGKSHFKENETDLKKQTKTKKKQLYNKKNKNKQKH